MGGTISLDAIAVFARVAETQSFRRAAETLGVPRSTVSRRIAELEKQLGTRLLRRTTRSVQLTDEGAAYLRACEPALGALDEAARSIQKGVVEAGGRLRVTAPVSFGERSLGPIIHHFIQTNARMELEILLADRQVDLLQEGFDVGFRSGVGDTSLVAKELGRGTLRCVATRAYLAEHGTPKRPSDLADQGHECILYPPLAPHNRWRFRAGSRTVHVAVHGRVVANSLPLCLDLACRGLGIARVPYPLVADELAKGTVIELLPRFIPPPSVFHLVYASHDRTTPRLRAFLEAVSEKLSLPSE